MKVDLSQEQAKHIYYGINKEYAKEMIYRKQLKERETKKMNNHIWKVIPFILLVLFTIFALVLPYLH